MNQFKKSIKSGEDALKECEEDDLKVKIYSRMVKSYLSTGDIEGALRVGAEGMKETNKNEPIQKELQKAKEKQAETEQKRKDLYAKMMGNSFRTGSERAAGPNEPRDKESV
jgi:hypothetical protein